MKYIFLFLIICAILIGAFTLITNHYSISDNENNKPITDTIKNDSTIHNVSEKNNIKKTLENNVKPQKNDTINKNDKEQQRTKEAPDSFKTNNVQRTIKKKEEGIHTSDKELTKVSNLTPVEQNNQIKKIKNEEKLKLNEYNKNKLQK